MSNTVISYPIPAYQNLPIRSNYYMPSRYEISAIANGQTTTITTSTDHNYVIGQLVRIHIPPTFGIRELNEQKGYVILIPAANQVTVDIDSSFFNSFVSSIATTKPQICAIGDINQGNFNQPQAENIFIEGSFRNIS